MARDAEPRGVQATVAIDEEHIRSCREPRDGGLDAGELAIGEIRRNVREVRPHLDLHDLHGYEIVQAERHRNGVCNVPLVRNVDARDTRRSIGPVFLADRRRESLLLRSKAPEQGDRRETVHEGIRRDATVREPDALAVKGSRAPLHNGGPVRADHPMRARNLGMPSEPFCDGPG